MADTYTITSIVPRQRAAPGGQFQAVMQVGFVTKPSGMEGTVEIPEQMFSPSEADKVITAKAELLERVKAL